MANEHGTSTIDSRELALFKQNVERVGKAVEGGMFAPAIEAACRLIVNESRRRDRPLAWMDITGNLRASISFQVEHYVGPEPMPALDGSGDLYNAVEYHSGHDKTSGVYGVVFAPPEYAQHVEVKSSRSVLLEPVATIESALRKAIGTSAQQEWAEFTFKQRARGYV